VETTQGLPDDILLNANRMALAKKQVRLSGIPRTTTSAGPVLISFRQYTLACKGWYDAQDFIC
jgi:hypothetical protein